ncbi:3950_t:CDS:2 [Entrophospora sp. SA101]|nr:60_t:CDS:2 [Entrophospora sp. SA101]CAJ0846283.1 12248_t:CDS:2 [Entrophospora sp. SA101]CAJ0877742.1 3950_t:CDS:2 [Entrophospora sp. SA101]CAJ0916668.1 18937_t:CDS:2 [Entrophospora sp. SA101]
MKVLTILIGLLLFLNNSLQTTYGGLVRRITNTGVVSIPKDFSSWNLCSSIAATSVSFHVAFDPKPTDVPTTSFGEITPGNMTATKDFIGLIVSFQSNGVKYFQCGNVQDESHLLVCGTVDVSWPSAPSGIYCLSVQNPNIVDYLVSISFSYT